MSGRAIGVCPAWSDHGGLFFPSSARISTVDNGGPALPLVTGDYHICPRKHHGISVLQATGFARDYGRAYGCYYDSCGCGAHVVQCSAIVRTD